MPTSPTDHAEILRKRLQDLGQLVVDLEGIGECTDHFTLQMAEIEAELKELANPASLPALNA